MEYSRLLSVAPQAIQVQPLCWQRRVCLAASEPLPWFQGVLNVFYPFVDEVWRFANYLIFVPSCSLQSLTGFSVGLWL